MGTYLLILLLAVSHSSCDTVDRVNEKYVAFELSDESPNIVVPVTLQDSIPARLIFDTGWGIPTLDSVLVSQFPSLSPIGVQFQEYSVGSNWNPASARKCMLYFDPEFETLNLKLDNNPMNFGYWTVGNFYKTLGVNNVDGIMGIPSADSTKVWGFNFEREYITIQEADSFEMPKEYMLFPMKVVTHPHVAMAINVNYR